MSPTDREVLDALRSVPYPGFTRDIVALGIVTDLHVEPGKVRFALQITQGGAEVADRLRAAADAAVRRLPGVAEVTIAVRGAGASSPSLKMAGTRPSVAAAGSLERSLLPDVRQVVAVASGKGGVGKSTVAVNLAVALARLGGRVGLLDADIYGPSIPLMMGLAGERPVYDPERRKLIPFERYGVRFMSVGFLVNPDDALIWRGPLVMKAVEQLLRDVDWGALDVLVVDMPPGTGDVQLTLSQRVRLAGAVIVTTPQDVALADAIKGVTMFRKVEVPVLGLVENMSYFVCPHCSGRSEVFGHGGGRAQAGRLGVPFLGEVPLDGAIRDHGDRGCPTVATDPDSVQGQAFLALAGAVRDVLGTETGATPPLG